MTEILTSAAPPAECTCPAAAALARVESACRAMESHGYQPAYRQAVRWIREAVAGPIAEENR